MRHVGPAGRADRDDRDNRDNRDGQGSDATVEWMTADVAARCRAVLATLDATSASPHQLGNAAMLLRGAADDLISLVELVEGPEVASDVRPDDRGEFDLSFRHASNPRQAD